VTFYSSSSSWFGGALPPVLFIGQCSFVGKLVALLAFTLTAHLLYQA
jgi:hypothetical protein